MPLNIVPQMTSATAPKGVVAASSETVSAAWNAFNHDKSSIANAWQTVQTIPAWISYDIGERRTAQPTSYIVTSGNAGASSTTDYVPYEWEFQGSNNGTDWTVLDSRTGVNDWSTSAVVSKTYTVTGASFYRYFRLYITKTGNNGFTGSRNVRVYELEIFCGNVKVQTNVGESLTEYFKFDPKNIANSGTSSGQEHHLFTCAVPSGVTTDVSSSAKTITTDATLSCGGYSINRISSYDSFAQNVNLGFSAVGTKNVTIARTMYGRDYTCGSAFVTKGTESAVYEYTVTTPPPIWNLSGSNISVSTIETEQSSITVNNSGASAGSVRLSFSGMPTGMTIVPTTGATNPFTVNTEILSGATKTFDFDLAVTDNTPPGNHTITITPVEGGTIGQTTGGATVPSKAITIQVSVSEDVIAITASRTTVPHSAALPAYLLRGQWDTTNGLEPEDDDSNLGSGGSSRIITMTISNTGNIPGTVRLGITGPMVARYRLTTSGAWLVNSPTVTVAAGGSVNVYIVVGRPMVGSGDITIAPVVGEGNSTTFTLTRPDPEPFDPYIDATTNIIARTKGGQAIQADEYIRKDQLKGINGIDVIWDEETVDVIIKGDGTGSGTGGTGIQPTHVKYVDAGWEIYLNPAYDETYSEDLVNTRKFFYTIDAAIDSALQEDDYLTVPYLVIVYPNTYTLLAPIQLRRLIYLHFHDGAVLSYTATDDAPAMFIDNNEIILTDITGEGEFIVYPTANAGGIFKIDNSGANVIVQCKHAAVGNPTNNPTAYSIDINDTVTSTLGTFVSGNVRIFCRKWEGNLYVKVADTNDPISMIQCSEYVGGLRIALADGTNNGGNTSVEINRFQGDFYCRGQKNISFTVHSHNSLVKQVFVKGSVQATIRVPRLYSCIVSNSAKCSLDVFSGVAVATPSSAPSMTPSFPTMPAEASDLGRVQSAWQIVVSDSAILKAVLAFGVDYIKTTGTSDCQIKTGNLVRWLYVVAASVIDFSGHDVELLKEVRASDYNDDAYTNIVTATGRIRVVQGTIGSDS